MTSSNEPPDRIEALLERFIEVVLLILKASNERIRERLMSGWYSWQKNKMRDSIIWQMKLKPARITRDAEPDDSTPGKVDKSVFCLGNSGMARATNPIREVYAHENRQARQGKNTFSD